MMTKRTKQLFKIAILIMVSLVIFTILLFSFAAPALALFTSDAPQFYIPISFFPGLGIINLDEPAEYFSGLFTILVSVVAIFAVIKLMLCGFEYMMSESITTKSSALQCIWYVMGGLFLILLSVLILQTINPALLKLPFDPLKQRIEGSDTRKGLDPTQFRFMEFCFLDKQGNLQRFSIEKQCEDVLEAARRGSEEGLETSCSEDLCSISIPQITVFQALVPIVGPGNDTALKWNSENTDSCTGSAIAIDGEGTEFSASFNTGGATEGNQNFTVPDQTNVQITYTLKCTGPGGTVSRQVVVETKGLLGIIQSCTAGQACPCVQKDGFVLQSPTSPLANINACGISFSLFGDRTCCEYKPN